MRWKLGKLAGIDVYIHWSFWILPVWLFMSAMGGGGGFVTGLATVSLVFAVFGCVVLHELGHALMARQFGIGTHNITLYPIGGVASLERIPEKPHQELAIALAGPAVNLLIAGVLFFGFLLAGIGWQINPLNILGGSFLVNLLWINVLLLCFNLLPAFPMDGGRVLRAFLAMYMPYLSATTIAARIGQGVAILLGIIGLWNTSTLILVALFVFLAAQAELASVQSRFGWRQRSAQPGTYASTTETTFYPQRQEDGGIIWVSEVRTPADATSREQVVVFYPPPNRPY